ncbi:MAG: c-type cytochrome [Chloroflexi bacterium]|nr:c-type cytochrome [Chloroflexota bacterium]
MKSQKRLWFICVLSLFVILFSVIVKPVFAHAVPVLTSPLPNAVFADAPSEISIQYNEPVVANLSRIQILTQAGQTLDTSNIVTTDAESRTLMVIPTSPLSDGAYLVSWQVLSAVDGHTTSGSFSFGVGDVDLTAVSIDADVQIQISAFSVGARWFTLIGISLLMGLFAFRLLVWNPILADVDLEAEEEALDLAHAQMGIKIGTAGLVLIAIGLVLIFIDQTRSYNLLQFDNFQTWLGTQFGTVWLVRVFLIAVSHFNLSLFVDVKNGRQELRGWEWWAGLILTVGLALANALVSHSAALARDTQFAVMVDWAHVAAAAIWAGGLLFLAVALWQARSLGDESRSWLSLSIFLNFSSLAAISVGLVTASGVYLAAKHVGSWTSLVGTAYGIALLIKLGIALIVFALAWFNLFKLKPRLNAAYETSEAPESQQTVRFFSKLVRAEGVLVLLILIAAGLITDLQRGVDAPLLADAPGSTAVSYTDTDLTVDMVIEPALIGQNSFEIDLFDTNGQPIADAEEVSVRYTFLGQSIGSDTAFADSIGNGRYRVEGSQISLIGGWQIEVTVRRPGVFDTFAPFRLEAGLGGNIRSMDDGEIRPLEQFAKFMTVAAHGGTGAALLLFAIIWGIISTRAARTEWQLIPLLSISLLAFWTGAQHMLEFYENEYTPAKFTTNPILPDIESIAIGQQLYTQNCLPCHGLQGYGDGPTGLTLNPPPVDFTDGHTATHTDGDLYYWILEGVEDSAMPAWEEQVSREEAWHLVNYLRRLSANRS